MNEDKAYNITLVLKFKVIKKLHVGNGALAMKLRADLQLTRMREDEIIIPASTIKGVLRTCMIRIAPLLAYQVKNASVYPTNIREDDIITTLMGKPDGYRSKIVVTPVLLGNLQPFILNHVSIDDKYGIAKEGNLFTIEYIPYGTQFECTIYAHHVSIEEARLLFLAIVEMNNETFGRGGIVEVSIAKEKSIIPEEIRNDSVILEVLK